MYLLNNIKNYVNTFQLGIKAIFDPKNSGLNRIFQNEEPLVVSKAIQKAFIEVNEEGAEAAAATGTYSFYYLILAALN